MKRKKWIDWINPYQWYDFGVFLFIWWFRGFNATWKREMRRVVSPEEFDDMPIHERVVTKRFHCLPLTLEEHKWEDNFASQSPRHHAEIQLTKNPEAMMKAIGQMIKLNRLTKEQQAKQLEEAEGIDPVNKSVSKLIARLPLTMTDRAHIAQWASSSPEHKEFIDLLYDEKATDKWEIEERKKNEDFELHGLTEVEQRQMWLNMERHFLLQFGQKWPSPQNDK